ncbi:MAG: M28 family metallopeptidase [Flavobacteriaceae bacterium]
MKKIVFIVALMLGLNLNAQGVPEVQNAKVYELKAMVSEDRLSSDLETLVGFGTRHTMSDTLSNTRGIGAARRWIKKEFDKIAQGCNGCMEVFYQRRLVKGDSTSRISVDTEIVNVIAVLKGKSPTASYVAMTGDIDSRISDVMNFTDDAPGANDNATGIAGILEAARVMSSMEFENNVVFAALSGEEQGLYGGKFLAELFQEKQWNVIGVLNNDMIGNIEGVDGVIDNREFRIFSEPTSVTDSPRQVRLRRFYGGENDGPSRQLARYVYETTDQYAPELRPKLIYRLDRFGRGGHHRPFNDLGFAGVRIMEAHENYNRQHQDIRTENGIAYGDVLEGVNIPYLKKMTQVNLMSLARLAWAPNTPAEVGIGGAVQADTFLRWSASEDPQTIGYYIYWRETDVSKWEHRIFVSETEHTLKGFVIDNYLFGVSAVNKSGDESIVQFPNKILR